MTYFIDLISLCAYINIIREVDIIRQFYATHFVEFDEIPKNLHDLKQFIMTPIYNLKIASTL